MPSITHHPSAALKRNLRISRSIIAMFIEDTWGERRQVGQVEGVSPPRGCLQLPVYKIESECLISSDQCLRALPELRET